MKTLILAMLFASAAVVLAVSAGVKAATPSVYEPMSFSDFMIDAPQLAARQAKIQISGTFIMDGAVAVMYENAGAALVDKYGGRSEPFIGLLTDNASHNLRAVLYRCISDGNVQGICEITVRGTASACERQNIYGATADTTCIDVDDGELYVPPPPPPPTAEQLEQLRQQMATQQAEDKRQQQIAQAQTDAHARAAYERSLGIWQNRMQKCMAFLSASPSVRPDFCARELPKPTDPMLHGSGVTAETPVIQSTPASSEIFNRCMDYLHSVGEKENVPGEFAAVCSKEHQ